MSDARDRRPFATPLRVVFFGTAELACPALQALADRAGIDLAAVVTQPDRPRGRHLKCQPPPVKSLALRLGLTLLQPQKARDQTFLDQMRMLGPELIVVAAYGQILPGAILDLPRFGCINIHASLLPKYRGAAPIQWAMLDGETETGITLMKMDVGLDTGPILAQEPLAITAGDNAQTLHDRLAALGARFLIDTLPAYLAGNLSPQPQPAVGASYARKITKEDGRIDWTQPAPVLWNRIRALVPWPGAFTYWPAEPQARLLKIWRAEVLDPPERRGAGEVLSSSSGELVVACADRALRVLELQLEGGKRLTAPQFLAGHPAEPGWKLGLPPQGDPGLTASGPGP